MVTREWGDFVLVEPTGADASQLIIPVAERHHLLKVRRAGAGTSVWATDGRGMVYECELDSPDALRVVSSYPGYGEPPAPVILLAGILKGDGNRQIVDSAVQLGATGIVFFRGERSEGRLEAEKVEKLRRVAAASIKQCGRACLPDIRIAHSFHDEIAILPARSTRFLALAADEPPAAPILSGAAAFVLAVGPEGGFSDTEIRIGLESGFAVLHLANRRLRSETAVAAGLAVIATYMEGRPPTMASR